MRPPRFYIYKCVVDDGGAPCVFRGLYSLSICKPAIRRTADEADIIFAFGSNNNEDPPNRLVYIAVVTKVVPDGAYYERPEFTDRPDCIYRRRRNGEFVLRDDARFHTTIDCRMIDLGKSPNHPNAITLISDDFRYFGASGNGDWKAAAPHLTRLVETLGQGHRVKLTDELRKELRLLKERTWNAHVRKKILGKPLHPPDTDDSPESDDVIKVCSNRELLSATATEDANVNEQAQRLLIATDRCS